MLDLLKTPNYIPLQHFYWFDALFFVTFSKYPENTPFWLLTSIPISAKIRIIITRLLREPCKEVFIVRNLCYDFLHNDILRTYLRSLA
jgi:hypothetical protein